MFSIAVLRGLVAAALAATLLGGTVAASAAAEFSPELQSVIAGAKAENELDLMWGEGTLGGSRAVKLFEDRINAMFGTSLRVKFTPGPSMPQVGNDVALRAAAGQPSATDVFTSYGDVLSRLYLRQLFMTVPWQKLLPGRITAAMIEDEGAAVKNTTGLVGVSYNPKLVPYEPKLLTDFLKPEWKGKIASTPYAANFDILSGDSLWGPAKALEFAQGISAQASGMMRCNEGERLATGEFAALVMNCDNTNFADMIAKGAPIKAAVMGDFTAKLYTYLAVPKNAPHPNAAKLFVVYASTPQGQAQLWDTTMTDLDLFPESHIARDIAAVEKQFHANFTPIDIQWHIDHPEAYENWKKISDVFTKR